MTWLLGQIGLALLLAVIEVGRNFHLTDVAGVFDARMVRIYRRIGWEPTVLGTKGTGKEAISVGLWDVSAPVREKLLRRTGVSDEVSRNWFDRSFGAVNRPQLAKIA